MLSPDRYPQKPVGLTGETEAGGTDPPLRRCSGKHDDPHPRVCRQLHAVYSTTIDANLQAEQAECLGVVRKSEISVMSVGHRPTNLRAGDAREQLTRILEPLDPESEGREIKPNI